MKQLTKNKFPKYTRSSYNSMPEKQTIHSKSGERPKQTFLRRRHTNGQQIDKKMLNIAHYYRNANQNCHLTPVRYHLTVVRKAIIKNSTNNTCWRGYGEKGMLLHCLWECKLTQPLWKMVISSVQFSRSVMSNSLQPHESQHTRSPCPSPTPGDHANSCPSSR